MGNWKFYFLYNTVPQPGYFIDNFRLDFFAFS